MAAAEKYPVLTRDNLTIRIQTQLPQKQKTFNGFYAVFLKSGIDFTYFWENDDAQRFFISEILAFVKTSSDKCLKGPISDKPSSSNMVNVQKRSWNQHHSTFSIFIDDCQVKWVGKCVSYWHAKSSDCFLIHWLTMKSILFLLETIERYQFRCNYVRKKTFPQFLAPFFKCTLNFRYFEIKNDAHIFCISDFTASENVVW